MKIAIIGTTALKDKMSLHKLALETALSNCSVRLPLFDDYNGSLYDLIMYNKKNIEWANEVHLFWDGRSLGTMFDLGMTVALNKPLKIIYLEEKDNRQFVKEYANKTNRR